MSIDGSQPDDAARWLAWTGVTSAVEGTRQLGMCLAEVLEPSSLVSINGELGAGKTQLVQGIVHGLGCTALAISPTYTLLVPYQGRINVYHGDAYRIRSGDEVFELGIEELLAEGGLVLMEWGDRIAPWLPSVTLRIELQTLDETSRRITVTTDRCDRVTKIRHCLESCPISGDQSLPVQS